MELSHLTAEYRDIQDALQIIYARHSTVSLLEHSQSHEVKESGETDASVGENDLEDSSVLESKDEDLSGRVVETHSSTGKQMPILRKSEPGENVAIVALLNNSVYSSNTNSRHFLREYLMAFSEHIQLSSAAETSSKSNPLEILKRQMVAIFRKEAAASRLVAEKNILSLWSSSLTRKLTIEILQEFIVLAAGPQNSMTSGLQCGSTAMFDLVWSSLRIDDALRSFKSHQNPSQHGDEDHGFKDSGASIWRPRAPPGFFILGDVAVSHRTKYVGQNVLVVRDDGELVAPPISFEMIWSDNGIAIWRPIPPSGYVALGCVATPVGLTNEEMQTKDGIDSLRCVHESCVYASDFTDMSSNHGSENLYSYSVSEDDLTASCKSKAIPTLNPAGLGIWQVHFTSCFLSLTMSSDFIFMLLFAASVLTMLKAHLFSSARSCWRLWANLSLLADCASLSSCSL